VEIEEGFMFRFLLALAKEYDRCPECGGTNIGEKDNIWFCYECEKEW